MTGIFSNRQLSPQSFQLHNCAYFYTGDTVAIKNSISKEFMHCLVTSINSSPSFQVEETNKDFAERALMQNHRVKHILYNKYVFPNLLDNSQLNPSQMQFIEEYVEDRDGKLNILKSSEDHKWTHNGSHFTSLATQKKVNLIPCFADLLPAAEGPWAEKRMPSRFNVNLAPKSFIDAQRKMILCFAHALGKNALLVSELISPTITCQLLEPVPGCGGGKVTRAKTDNAEQFMERLMKISNSIKKVFEYSINFYCPPATGRHRYPPLENCEKMTWLYVKVFQKLLIEEDGCEYIVQSSTEQEWGYYQGVFTHIELTEIAKSKKAVGASASFCAVQ